MRHKEPQDTDSQVEDRLGYPRKKKKLVLTREWGASRSEVSHGAGQIRKSKIVQDCFKSKRRGQSVSGDQGEVNQEF